MRGDVAMAGTLTVVGTPIGNLGDMSPRGVKALEEADFIAAEDTRVTQKLTSHFGIKKQLVSYHQHSREAVSEQILARILAGESCAVVTDAGMPCISDPGEDLVRRCAQAGAEVIVVPGPSAAISALAVSGLATSRFAFEGFLSMNRKNRAAHLAAVREDTRTLIFYEAPHKLRATLADMLAAFGEREIALARELTKLHEEVIRTTLSAAVQRYRETEPRGEYVLIVAGAPERTDEPVALEDAVALALSLHAAGEPLTSAAKHAAQETGHKKSELYTACLKQLPGRAT